MGKRSRKPVRTQRDNAGARRFLAFLSVAAITAVAMIYMAESRTPPTDYVSTYQPAIPNPPVRVAVLGDSYTGGSEMGGLERNGWALLVQQRLTEPMDPVTFTVNGRGGSGYVRPGTEKTTFVDQVPVTVRSDHDIVVFFGSRNDGTIPVAEAARLAYSEVRRITPTATLIVIGPAWTNDAVPESIYRLRDQLAAETVAAGGTFVDPLAEGWFFGPNSRLIGTDGVHPTDEGHQYMADLIEPHIRSALPADLSPAV